MSKIINGVASEYEMPPTNNKNIIVWGKDCEKCKRNYENSDEGKKVSFKDRVKLVQEYDEWLKENKIVMDCPLNVITYLNSKNMLCCREKISLMGDVKVPVKLQGVLLMKENEMKRCDDPICKKMELVKYMMARHREWYGREISPIKLQKSLYFLYAMWGGKIKKIDIISNKNSWEKRGTMIEDKFPYSINLFDASFEAWGYGCVDREVYFWYKNLSNEEKSRMKNETLTEVKYINEYIENLLGRMYKLGDFDLVQLCFRDNCWSSAYDNTKTKKIWNGDILYEYGMRFIECSTYDFMEGNEKLKNRGTISY